LVIPILAISIAIKLIRFDASRVHDQPDWQSHEAKDQRANSKPELEVWQKAQE
jgi:hypothetical protein